MKDSQNTWDGIYEYKGFFIQSPSDKVWRCFPDWSIEALEKYQGSAEDIDHKTIAQAKKWIREYGIHLKESGYL